MGEAYMLNPNMPSNKDEVAKLRLIHGTRIVSKKLGLPAATCQSSCLVLFRMFLQLFVFILKLSPFFPNRSTGYEGVAARNIGQVHS
jgi:hypothetical protein